MLKSLPVRILWHSLNWLTRLAIVSAATLAVLIAMSIVALRYWILPDIEQYHDRITSSLSLGIGSPVTIGRIEASWQGLRPRLSLTDVNILDERRQPALVLSRIDGSLSWMTLLTAELRLANLEIDRPELLIRRDAQGDLFIGGIKLSRQGGNNDLADWLLHQSHMAVHDALIVWLDEQRNAPLLLLQHVELSVRNGLFDRHRFALRALPPEELATPLDVRGDFSGGSFDDLAAWRGQIFTQLDYTDVTAWRPWLDLPGAFSRGRGALRGWLGIEGGKVAQVTADLDLRGVATRLGEGLPEMDVQKLRGRAAWKYAGNELEISTRHLSMRLYNGIELWPTDFYYRIASAKGERPAGGELRANLLQLETLAALSDFLPLEASLRDRLTAYAPRGKVSNLEAEWQGTLAQPDTYRIKGSFDNLALRRVGQMPGFSGLSMEVNGDETGGRLNINSRQLVVDAPDALREPLSFTTLTGQAGWRRKHGELLVTVDNVAVTNDDLAGNLYGNYLTQAGTLGMLDLTVALTRGDVRRAARYTPLVALDREDNDWLNGAMLAGQTDDFRVRIKGNLSDFPLDGTKKDALLEIGGHARGVVLEFDKEWPKVENIDGEFWIRGNKLEVKSDSATMLGARLRNLKVAIPDLMSEDLPLEIRGEADATSETFLQFIQQSPVRGYIDGFTDGMHASGNGHLQLFTRVPLLSDKPVQVAGTVRVQDNDIDLGKGVPWLRKARGALSFTEAGLKSEGVSAEILGGRATVDVRTTEDGAVHANAQGRVNLDVLRSTDSNPLLNYLRGSTAWDANIAVVKKSARIQINSSLVGIYSSLPQPFAKRAWEPMPLRVEKDNVVDGQDIVTVQLGRLLNARVARRDENGEMAVKRGVVSFGGAGRWPAQDGIWLTGRVPVLSLEGWGGLFGDGSGSDGLPVGGADLVVGKASGFGTSIDDLRIAADKRDDGIVARLSSDEVNGEVEWQPRGEGKITARLQNLVWKEAGNGKPAPAKSSSISPDNLPALQIGIENLQVKGKQIGRFELVGYPEGNDWRLRRLLVTNPDGSLSGDGVWHGDGDARTSVNLMLDISDAGKILARSGYPNTVKGGSGRLAANLSWAGTPDEFNYATLNGTLNLDTGKGQFLKMDPGIGKLLGILSLQALPKRITLDFNDVFSNGFQFDSIKGNAQVGNGVLETQDLRLDGSAAKVTMRGRVDLNRETQDLRVRVLPTLGDSVSLLGAFAAGPVVGVGALVVNKVLGEPLDKLMSFEYNVSGTWSDPKVVKVGEVPAKPEVPARSKEINPQ